MNCVLGKTDRINLLMTSYYATFRFSEKQRSFQVHEFWVRSWSFVAD